MKCKHGVNTDGPGECAECIVEDPNFNEKLDRYFKAEAFLDTKTDIEIRAIWKNIRDWNLDKLSSECTMNDIPAPEWCELVWEQTDKRNLEV